jgi:hypothetical protein
MKYDDEAARHIVLDQIMSHVHDACPYAGDSQQRKWDEVILSTMATDALDSLKSILYEWQEDVL